MPMGACEMKAYSSLSLRADLTLVRLLPPTLMLIAGLGRHKARGGSAERDLAGGAYPMSRPAKMWQAFPDRPEGAFPDRVSPHAIRRRAVVRLSHTPECLHLSASNSIQYTPHV